MDRGEIMRKLINNNLIKKNETISVNVMKSLIRSQNIS